MSIFTTSKVCYKALVERNIMVYITQNDFLLQVTPFLISTHKLSIFVLFMMWLVYLLKAMVWGESNATKYSTATYVTCS